MVDLPESLTDLDIPLNGPKKQQPYTKHHEMMLATMFSADTFKNLQRIKFGIDNIHTKAWERNSQGWLKKPGWFRDIEGGGQVMETVVMVPHSENGYYPQVINTEAVIL